MTGLFQNISLLVPVAGFLAIFLLCIGVLQYRRQAGARKEIFGRLQESSGMTDVLAEESFLDVNSSQSKSIILDFFGKLGGCFKKNSADEEFTSNFKFLKAGIKRKKAAAIFWGIKCVLVLILPSLFLVFRLSVFKMANPQLVIIFTVFLALLGFYLPDIWLSKKTENRKQKLLKGLPDALDLLVICVEAGMGLDEAVNRVAGEIKLKSQVLGDELSLVGLELRAGMQRQDALRNLAMRTDLEEVNNLSTLLIQADKFGTSIGDTLRVYSDSFRTQRFQRAEEIAAKIPVKLIFPLILFIFPSLFVVVVGPAALTIYHNIILR